MKSICYALVVFTLLASVSGYTFAQDEDGGVAVDGSRGYPGVSLGARLELLSFNIAEVTSQGFVGFSHPVLFEFDVNIIEQLSLYALAGTYLSSERTEDEFEDTTARTGTLLLGGGARFNFSPPEPRRAHLYVAGDFIGAIGLVTRKDDDAEDDVLEEEEDSVKEQMDHALFSAALGIEFLVAPEFSIAAEVAGRFMINRLKDVRPEVDIDKDRVALFTTTFGLRFMYHF